MTRARLWFGDEVKADGMTIKNLMQQQNLLTGCIKQQIRCLEDDIYEPAPKRRKSSKGHINLKKETELRQSDIDS